jgi:HEAT repeat protein
MATKMLRCIAALLALCAVVLTGCALDPMERLKEDIDSQDVKVRERAVIELANLRDDRAIESLADVLETDEDVYDMAGVALVKQGREVVTDKKPDPIIAMVAAIMNNVHLAAANRCRAAWVLGEIGDREAIPELRKGAGTKDAAGKPAVPVQDQAKLSLKKLGNDSDGAAFEIPMAEFTSEPVKVLPTVASVAPPEEEAENKEAAPAAPAAAAKTPPKG